MLEDLELPQRFGQAIVVTTDSWEGRNGNLARFQRSGAGWREIGSSIPVVVGKSGLGWGRGLHDDIDEAPQKKEGDGRGPAGLFTIGPVFGSSERPPDGTRMQYRQATGQDYYIDDPESADYNSWVKLPAERNTPFENWKTFEKMLREDGLYKYGIVVRQNTDPVVSGDGSAVFIHIWRAPEVGTEGCTAMAEQHIAELIAWLEPGLEPILVQAPGAELSKIKYRK